MLLRDSGADIVPPDDEAAIASVIRHRYEQYARGVRPEPIGVGGQFHRRHQAARLLDELEQRLGAYRPTPQPAPRPALALADDARTTSR
jgi:hypothetical protein